VYTLVLLQVWLKEGGSWEPHVTLTLVAVTCWKGWRNGTSNE
jgi:hypothetical protein